MDTSTRIHTMDARVMDDCGRHVLRHRVHNSRGVIRVAEGAV